jgi:ubiquinone/menaquinone biosynthesis C-methylase UbiE
VSQLEFDEEVSKRIEAAYSKRDVLRRRALVREALQLEPGHRVLDVGCGPGFYAAEILDIVGPEGSVVGIDSAQAMLTLAAKRCEGRANAVFSEGEATSLPVGDGEFDAALSVQVLEYVEDIPGALAEIRRALKPAGKVVIWDVDWVTLSMNTSDPDRMQRMLAAWDEHLADPSLPRRLTGELGEAGFEDIRMEGHVFATNWLDPESYAGFLTPFLAEFVRERESVPGEEIDAWLAEQRELDERGGFYFAAIQFCFSARKPA